MSDIIRLLPDSVANQIAAGEVIQRPASVIKELVENAVDAGAKDIHIEVKDAGKTWIRIVDNGSGMSETDARMAFERHATSKIRNADDLFTLRSMGFRGEALPSICAISEVEVKTRKAGAPMGTRLVIVGSKVETQEPCVCDEGTVMTVKKLFFNVPARRKFLKSDNVELSNIMREFERLALVNNRIHIGIDTGSRTIDLRPGSLRQRIEDIWKNNLAPDSLIPVDVDTSLVKIEGFVSRPEFARRRNPLQFLIVNGRNMVHPYFRKAILSCFESLIATDTQPCFFMKFTVDPASIDVNIHPTKNEIKFEYEQQIWPILVSAVKTALGKFAAVPTIDFTAEAIPFHPLSPGEKPKMPTSEFRGDYNPFRSGGGGHATRVDSSWEKLYEGFRCNDPSEKLPPLGDDFQNTRLQGVSQNEDAGGSESALFGEKEEKGELAPFCIQFALKYIVTTSEEGLIIIDQHRAHVKILYEEYLRKAEKNEMVSQSVMFPETIELDAAQQAALDEVSEELRKAGFRLEYDSGNTWRIEGVPSVSGNLPARDVIYRILESVSEDSVNYGKDASATVETAPMPMKRRVALVLARSTAIRRGVKLSQNEMESLLGQLFSLPDPSLSPNGLPIFRLLTDQSITKMLS